MASKWGKWYVDRKVRQLYRDAEYNVYYIAKKRKVYVTKKIAGAWLDKLIHQADEIIERS